MKVIKIKKGLDIKLKGKPLEKISPPLNFTHYGIYPYDYRIITPKLNVKIGDKVKAGTPILFDKTQTDVCVSSPVSGIVENIIYGEKRKLETIIIKADNEIEYEQFATTSISLLSREQIIDQLLKSGLFVKIKRRPYGIVPKINEIPKHIHISTFDTSPLAPNFNFSLKENISEIQTGIDILSKLTNGKVFLNIDGNIAKNIFENLTNCEITKFYGPHPAGNVGVQIHHLTPIVTKEDIVWTINIQDLVFIGRFFNSGKIDLRKTIALSGSEVNEPHYYQVIEGCQIFTLIENQVKNQNVRIISGNVLTGITTPKEMFLHAFTNQITVIPEGNYYEMFGWAKPGFNKYSVYGTFLSKIFKNKEWTLDSNYHGGHRTFVITGRIDKYLPMDIMPEYLLKAALVDDIDNMEKLGIYEIIEEDIALCEFASETKMDFQPIITNAINLMIKEVE